MNAHIRLLLIPAALLLAGCRSGAPTPRPTITSVAAAATTAPASAVTGTPGTGQPTAVPTSPAKPLPAPALFNVPWGERSVFRGGLVDSEQGVLDQLPGASVYHIDLRIADDMTHVEGHEEVRYTNQETVTLHEVYFRLLSNLIGGEDRVSGVKVNGVAAEPSYESQNIAMRVPLASPLQPGQQVVIQMDFADTVPTQVERNYGVFAYKDGILALAHSYPMIPAYDSQGWHIEVPPEWGDLVYADSSFYLVRVTAPVSQTIVASGIQIDRRVSPSDQISTFAAGPVRDFYIAMGNSFIASRQMVGQTKITSYAPAGAADGEQRTLDYAAKTIRDYSARFGAYPFTKFDVVGTPNLALGIEYPTVIAITLHIYQSQGSTSGAANDAVLESTVAHETAHQWFYSVVGDDQVNQPWLDESLAQYATEEYFANVDGLAAAAAFDATFHRRWDSANDADIPIGLPVKAYTPQTYSAIVYGRGPLFLEALAQNMGQKTFDQFMRDYFATEKWGVSTTEVFQHIAEQHCGCDLTSMFKQWVYPK